MKLSKILNLVAVAALFITAGCKKGPVNPTPLPRQGLSQFGEPTSPPLDVTNKTPDLATPPLANNTPPFIPNANPNPNPLPPGGETVTSLPKPPDGNPAGNIAQGDDMSTWGPADVQPFKSETLYFEFDKSNVRATEMPKIRRVADAMKNYSGKGLRIEGHCDERGTEEYNRALGEKRALSIREHLVRMGVPANRVATISYGEDKPVDPGHNEAAFSKNRRGEFILLAPPK